MDTKNKCERQTIKQLLQKTSANLLAEKVSSSQAVQEPAIFTAMSLDTLSIPMQVSRPDVSSSSSTHIPTEIAHVKAEAGRKRKGKRSSVETRPVAVQSRVSDQSTASADNDKEKSKKKRKQRGSSAVDRNSDELLISEQQQQQQPVVVPNCSDLNQSLLEIQNEHQETPTSDLIVDLASLESNKKKILILEKLFILSCF